MTAYKKKKKNKEKMMLIAKTESAADEGHPRRLSHPPCLPTHVIQTA